MQQQAVVGLIGCLDETAGEGAIIAVERRFAAHAQEAPSALRHAWQFAAFVAAYLVTGFGHREPLLVLAILGVALVLRLAIVRPDRVMVATLLALAVVGTTYELVVTSVPGTFDYTDAGLGSVPVWLPLLYAHAGVVACTTIRRARGASAS